MSIRPLGGPPAIARGIVLEGIVGRGSIAHGREEALDVFCGVAARIEEAPGNLAIGQPERRSARPGPENLAHRPLGEGVLSLARGIGRGAVALRSSAVKIRG
jgi:hypothetical protein